MPVVRKPDSRFFWYDLRYRGRRYRGSTKETSKAAARQFEARFIAKLEQGDELPVRGRRAPLLRDFMQQFLVSFDANQLRADKTKLYYRSGAALLLATPIGDFPVDRITTSTVSALRFPHSAYTANNEVRTLRRVLSYAVELGHIRTVPRMHLHRETGRDTTFTPDYEARLLSVAAQPLADVFVILMDTGLRPTEAFCLHWEDVRWTENLLQVKSGKTAAARRVVGMSARVREVLVRRARSSGDSPWVFPSKRRSKSCRDANAPKGAEHIQTVNKAFAKARKDAGLPKELVLYATRHTFGTDLMEATGNQKLTMKTMGHVDVKTSARYQHPGTGRVAGVIDERNAQRKTATMENGHGFGHSTLPIQ